MRDSDVDRQGLPVDGERACVHDGSLTLGAAPPAAPPDLGITFLLATTAGNGFVGSSRGVTAVFPGVAALTNNWLVLVGRPYPGSDADRCTGSGYREPPRRGSHRCRAAVLLRPRGW